MIRPLIKTTDDGSQTLIHPLSGDGYHSMRGAEGEAMHVFIREGFLWTDADSVRVLEVGFGSGLNALLTAREAEKRNKPTEYHTIELYPVEESIISEMGYASDPLFGALHKAEWGRIVNISPFFSIKKIGASLLNYKFDTTFDLVYFDAFAPDTQPEMWSEQVFQNIWDHMSKGGILVTYSAKGDVKRALRGAGFEVKRLAGALGKRHMLRAVKI